MTGALDPSRWPGSTHDGRHLVPAEPELFEELAQFAKPRRVGRLDDVGVGPEQIRLVHVSLGSGRREDQDNDCFPSRLLPNPLQHFQAGFMRQIEIENDEARFRRFPLADSLARIVEKVDGRLPVVGDLYREFDATSAKSARYKIHVVRVVLDVENETIAFQAARFSSIQNRLPSPG